jgi:hypothetical protein
MVRVLVRIHLQQTSHLAMPKGEKAAKERKKNLLGVVVGGKHQTILYLL